MTYFEKDLFVLDLANNHFGDLGHAKRIIQELSVVTSDLNVRIAIKFQFRDLDTFIHPNFQERLDIKYVNRFLSTRLSDKDFYELAKITKSFGFISMATPFDENSVDLLENLDIEILKVASASADDYPLLKRISQTKKSIVASTGGLSLEEIDRLVQILESSKNNFAIMHCVSIYPSPDNSLHLSQISQLRKRYPRIPIGWSTHENPANLLPVVVAKAQGAQLFERHVGIKTNEYPLNSYSSSPEQVRDWIMAKLDADVILGPENRLPKPKEEVETLRELKRGIFLKRDI